MAQAVRLPGPVQKIHRTIVEEVPGEDMVHLDLTLQEAANLRNILGHIDGGGPLRGLVNEVWAALDRIHVGSGRFPWVQDNTPKLREDTFGIEVSSSSVGQGSTSTNC